MLHWIPGVPLSLASLLNIGPTDPFYTVNLSPVALLLKRPTDTLYTVNISQIALLFKQSTDSLYTVNISQLASLLKRLAGHLYTLRYILWTSLWCSMGSVSIHSHMWQSLSWDSDCQIWELMEGFLSQDCDNVVKLQGMYILLCWSPITPVISSSIFSELRDWSFNHYLVLSANKGTRQIRNKYICKQYVVYLKSSKQIFWNQWRNQLLIIRVMFCQNIQLNSGVYVA